MPVYFVLIPAANAEIVPFVWETKKWFQLLIAETIYCETFFHQGSKKADFTCDNIHQPVFSMNQAVATVAIVTS